MKPLLMRLQAFGPYAGREVVDFRPALDSGLFGIYGPTGSGKSSIFSAMTFALFGEAAKTDQDAKSLRSDHADSGVVTEVELIFEIGGRRYRVVRRPEQTRPSKRGGGETKDSHKASLFDVTGLDLESLGQTKTGKVVAEGRLKAVDDAITGVLGYGAAQFRQIVLLPQGKFETFLTAETKERLAILRDLFDVSLFRRLTDRMKDEAKAAEDEIRTARSVCQGRLQAETFESLEALANGIAEANKRHEALASTAHQLGPTRDRAEQAFQRAAQIDANFQAHIAAQAEAMRLESERPAMDAVTARLAGARVAHSLVPADEAVEAARTDTAEADRRLAAARGNLSAATEAEIRAARALQMAMGNQVEAEAWRTSLRDVQRHAQTLAEAGPLQAAADEAEAQASVAMETSLRLKSQHDRLVNQIAAIRRELEAARAAEMRRATLSQRISETKRVLVAAEAHEKATAQAAAARDEAARRLQESQTAAQLLAAAELSHRAAERALLDDHALAIAARLENGLPCPVCGSKHHPAPARGSPEADARSEAFHRSKLDYEKAETAAREASGRLHLAEQRLTDRGEALASLSCPEQSSQDLATELAAREAEVAALGPAADLDALTAACRASEQQSAEALRAYEAARVEATAKDTARALALRSRDDALRTVPADLRDRDRLDAERALLASRIESHDKTVQQAQSTHQQAREALIAAERDLANASASQRTAVERLAAAEAGFATRLAVHDLSAQSYAAHKADIAKIDAYSAQIDAYRQRCSIVAHRLCEASERIAGLQRPDLASLESERDGAAAALLAATQAAISAAHHARHLEALHASIAEELARLEALEAQTGPLRALADAFSGKAGPKVDLETFAIGTMFDRVLEAANLRLGPMTRGRYSLVRELQGGGSGRQGLGIAVDDSHTGRQRATSTLSGGETFIAALALALGLSEIVESERGSVRLDTIFIDEGFGSLDSENDAGTLEQVLQTLQDLVGRSRTVGLISHVPLVQQTIPTGFQVTSSPSGSRIDFRSA